MGLLSKVAKGQVWFIPDQRNKITPGIIAKDRPWLVVSSNASNSSCSVFQALPITTHRTVRGPHEVHFILNDNGYERNQVIQANQITTFSTEVLDQPGSFYMYTIQESLMLEVDKALLCQFDIGIQALLNNVSSAMQLLQAFADKIISMSEDQKEVTAAERILNNVLSSLESTTQVKNNSCGNSPTFPNRMSRKQTNKTSTSSKNTWTLDRMQSYLNDSKVLSIDDMMKKYNLTKRATVSNYKVKFRKAVNNEAIGRRALGSGDG